jgi:Fur family ferric uptake transcriptional regulator
MKSQRTRSQKRILKVLKQLNRAISAQDLHAELRQTENSMGLATVYRSLDALKLEGLVQVRKLPNGESVYNLVQTDQHHLTCVNCQVSIPIDECPVHALEEELETSHSFKVYYHTLEFFGLCENCRLAAAQG